jgi:hypothetical protein
MTANTATAVAAAALWMLGPASAQTSPAARPGAEERPGPSGPEACAGKAAVYSAGSGPRVQVVRRGTLSRQNPLRPSSDPQSTLVLQVSINGKTAAAYGPSFEEMRRAGPPAWLERESGNAIDWEPDLAGLPQTITILSEDGPEVIARLRFAGCAAAAKQPRQKRSPEKRVPQPAEPERQAPPPRALPEGAIR